MFEQAFGCFALLGSYIEPEDYENSLGTGSDGYNFDTVKHFIVVNMGTRVVYGYPNVAVLEDADISNPGAYVERLAAPPPDGLSFLVHKERRGLVRQLFVKQSAASYTNYGKRSGSA